MAKNKYFSKLPLVIIMTAFLIYTVASPSVTAAGAAKGLCICADVIIPSLFPFTVCVLFIMRSGITDQLKKANSISQLLFGIDSECFTVFLLSMIGGYPVGATLINELCKKGAVSEKDACRILCCCINSGPAFIVLAVGNGMLASKELGYILLVSHIFSSVMLLYVFACGKIERTNNTSVNRDISASECFVSATSDAAASVLSICNNVVIFSAFNAVLNSAFSNIFPIKYITLFTEVTSAVSSTDNIYLISFLLGFSGFCVWFQIISNAKSFKISPLKFVLSRILHGLFSTAITFILCKIIKPSLPTLSNHTVFFSAERKNGVAIGISIFCMTVLLIISLFGKKRYGNLREDIV